MPPTPSSSGRDRLVTAALDHLLGAGSTDESLRAIASAVGVSHSLLLYHFGSTTGLLAAVYAACEQRERHHLHALDIGVTQPVAVMRAMWRHLADPSMWSVYRLSFALRLRADVPTDDEAQREAWAAELGPIVAALGVPRARIRAESLLWVATCRGLLWELITGADRRAVDHAAERFFAHYR